MILRRVRRISRLKSNAGAASTTWLSPKKNKKLVS